MTHLQDRDVFVFVHKWQWIFSPDRINVRKDDVLKPLECANKVCDARKHHLLVPTPLDKYQDQVQEISES